MKNLSLILAVLLLSAAPAVHAVGGNGVVVTYSETLEDVSLSTAAARNLVADAASETTLVFNALGQRFEVALEPNDRLLAGARGRARELGIYRGELVGKPNSWARITIADGVPTGLIWDGTEMLAIDASTSGTTGQRSPSIYRLKDTYIESGSLTCGMAGAAPSETTLATAYAAVADELEAVISQAPGAVEELKIGIVSDYEFTDAKGVNNVDNEVFIRMNNVDGIFSSQLGVQITVEVIDTFADPDDPFTSTVPLTLLEELGAYRAATASQRSQGLTFMFTGRSLDGRTAGIAYREALCNSRFGVGLAESVRDPASDSLIAAHEIGHNFGAQHDGETGSVCEAVTGDFLMSPTVSGTDQFSTCSKDWMQQFIEEARGRCITSLAQTDVAIALTNTPSTLLLGASTDLIFDVSNAGTGNATNVAATFVIPTNLTINSVATTVGSCASGGGQVACTIGTLPGSASASVALAVTAGSVGSGTLDASVTADGDPNPGDNSESVQIVVDPATDLRVANTSSRSVALDSSFSISPRIDNVSTLAASNLNLSVTFSTGLRVDSASWPNGTCTVGAGSVTCQRSSLAAGSSVSLDVQFTATATGSQSYGASVSSSEADADTSDNSASATVSVAGSGSIGSSSGGGTFGLLWSLLMATVVFLPRLRRP